jgi:NADH-quinone oxidoreductase subunit F
LLGRPTVVNNVETLAAVPWIVARGGAAYAARGHGASTGTKLVCLNARFARPGVYEVELGTPLRAVIDAVGSGVGAGRSVKAVFSGVANPVVTADQLDVPLSYEGFSAIGSGMGAAGFIVYDDTACMVDTAYRMSRFLYIESCGQCPPCKIGSGEITSILERIETGAGEDTDIANIEGWLTRVTDANRCYLGMEERLVVSSVLHAFSEEFVEHIEQHACPRPGRRPMPKLLDLADGTATYDERFWHKQPDWTFA